MRIILPAALCSALLMLSLILPGTAFCEDSKHTSGESSSKYSSEGSSTDTASTSGGDSGGGTTTIQSNCTAMSSSGLVPGVWVPQDNITATGAALGVTPEIEGMQSYREIKGM